jgi:sulfonate transport system substrate-binding protein
VHVATLAAVAVLAVVPLSGPSAEAATKGSSSLQVTPGAPVPAGTTLTVADQENLFKTQYDLSKAGAGVTYKVNWVEFTGGPPAIFEALNAGAVDVVSSVGDATTFGPLLAGQKFKIISVFDANNGYAILEARGQHINSLAGLKGKTIGFAQGTGTQEFIYSLLSEEHLTDKDVKLVPLTSAVSQTALEAGDVDTLVSAEPVIASYLAANPSTKVLWPATDEQQNVFIASDKALADPAKLAAITNFLARFKKSLEWSAQHFIAFNNAFYGSLHVPTSIIKQTIARTSPRKFLVIGASVIHSTQEAADQYAAFGAIPKTIDVGNLFTTAFNPVIEKS